MYIYKTKRMEYKMLIGRQAEIREIHRYMERDEAQFIAVYGRRRVGKTYLVREAFDNTFTFYHTGSYEAPLKDQLEQFRITLLKYGLKKCNKLKNWFEAFFKLDELIEQSKDKHKVIFIDELPWLDTPKSHFISALEHFWNAWASAQRNLTLVVCGSATSWIIKNLFNNHGGLYNRLTGRIYLEPFSLLECEEFSRAKHLSLSRKNIAEAYMILGGIPYYWNYLQANLSLSQNIDRMFFAENAPLRGEYKALYHSLFKNPEPYLKIVSLLSTKKSGMSRDELMHNCEFSSSNTFAQALQELEECGFIRKFYSIGKKKKDALFQLMDNFTLFHFQFIEGERPDENFWTNLGGTPQKFAWEGFSFERLCLWHLPQIKKTLGISGISTNTCSWLYKGDSDHDGAQIDLLIDRRDDTINLCEMKYSDKPYRLEKEEYEKLINRISTFRKVTKTNKAIHTTLITTVGLDHSGYWNEVQSTITLDDLFA